MHVAHVAAFGNPMPGSFIPNITELARTLCARGDRFTYVNENVPGAIWHDQVRASGADLVITRTQREVYEALVAARPDVIHTHFLTYTLPATLAARRTGARLLWHLHTGQSRPSNAIRKVRTHLRYSLLGSAAQRFVAVSESLAAELRSWGVGTRKVVVINNAIDVDRFRPPTAEERAERRTRFGLAEGETALTFFGRDMYCKGTDTLLDALTPPLPLTVLAVGLPEHLRAALARRVRTIELGHLADTRDVYWASDAIVMPSRWEAAPYTLMEAVSCGLPTIASAIPSIQELVANVQGVRLVPVEDAAALRAALAELQKSATPTELYPEARKRFSLNRWADDILALYA